jgi:nucleotide-binding universal stress UspA family protein
MRVLCAYRDPDNGGAALREARLLIHESDEIVVVHVVEPNDLHWQVPRDRLVSETEHQMDAREAQIAEAAETEGLRNTVVVVDVPDPGESTAHRIAREAREQDVDLLIVVSKRASGVRGLLLGSVAHALLQLAPCPVVVVRPDEADSH